MTPKRDFVIRVERAGPLGMYPDDQVFLYCLREAGIISVVDADLDARIDSFDIHCPSFAYDSENWADLNVKRFMSMGYAATKVQLEARA